MEVEKPTRILVLFSGTGSVETQFQRQFKGCEVVTVDILPKWDPLHAADILKWDYRQCPRHYFDVIWASPPCTEYIKTKTVGESDIKTADRRVQRTRENIDFYDPAYYFIENPAGDATRGLHTRPVMKGLPEPHLTMYCRYGAPYMKPTHIWTNAPISVPLLQCTGTTPCPTKATLKTHENTSQSGNSASNVPGMRSAQAAYAVPRTLLHHLFCELHLDEDIEDVNAVLEHISKTTSREYTEDFNENTHVEDLP
ncbi:hypothetical protein CYMTET_48611 [Cymbomonas tetramitiformis]|uniref:Uncharacterized protein n=1 Tax=Cymbomonas tetramitiformis TaxID=36881 RepID=A0AAE0EUZ1_9CHLO|nr:hypothetical protein CYMTET_48611 [Cymbomonas tetramitiformis]